MADAQITVGANADAATRAAAVVKSAWVEAGHAITSAMGSAAQQVVGDLASIATAQGKVSFASQHQQVRDFEQATARLAVAMGRDLNDVRSSIEQTGLAINKRPQEVAAWASSVGRLTYDFKGAADSMGAMAALAAQTGRTVDDYRGLAVQLGQVGVHGDGAAKVIGNIVAQSDQLKNAGGAAALVDRFEALGDSVTQFSDRSAQGIAKVVSLIGVLGKGMDEVSAKRVGQAAISAVTSDPRRWERYLGHHVLDEHGHVKDPAQTMREIYEKTAKRWKDPEARRNVLINNFGAELGSQLEYAGKTGEFGKMDALAGLGPSAKPANALAAYKGTDAGKREGAEAALSVSSRELMGSATLLGQAADKLQQFAAHNPFTSTLITTALTTGAGMFASSFGSSIAKMMGGSGAGGAVGGAVKLAGGLGAIGKAGIVGAEVAAIAAYGMHRWEVEKQNAHDEIQEEARADDASHAPELQSRVMLQRRANAAARNVKGLSAAEFGAGLNAMGAVVNADSKLALGGDAAQKAIADKLAAGGMSADDAAKIAKAFAAEMKNVKFNVTTRADTPVEVTGAGANHPAAGSQKGG